MLHITVFRDSQGNIAALEAEGHADYADIGNDIICAGASALIQTAILGLIKVLGIIPGLEKEDGYLYFTLPELSDRNLQEKSQVILETILLGLHEIMLKEPEKVRISSENLL
jgi:uncharacterized protein YsxB (DUF464 family)